MEAARAAEAAQASGVGQASNPVETGVATVLANESAQQSAPVEPQTPTPAATGGAPNVLDLLSKWQTKA